MAKVTFTRTGMRTILQDQGRPGHAHLGIGAGGAWDRHAAARANELVGNSAHAAVLECLLGGVEFHVEGEAVLLAVTGAPVEVLVAGAPRGMSQTILLHEGDVVSLGSPAAGLRTYVAVTGGFEGHMVFGSRSTDPTRGMGPAAVRAGDVLELAQDGHGVVRWERGGKIRPVPRQELVLHAIWGPRDDWFSEAAREVLARQEWQVTDETDRVGTRLSGATPLERAVSGELKSEATIRGAVQVPTSGFPLVFGPDCPTTGGYPVIAVVDGPDADLLSQASPGTRVRFDVRRQELHL